MKSFSYKGYIGSIHYSKEDKVFHGKIEGIKDLVTYEAESEEDLENAFKKSLDEYLEDCKVLGREPGLVPTSHFDRRYVKSFLQEERK